MTIQTPRPHRTWVLVAVLLVAAAALFAFSRTDLAALRFGTQSFTKAVRVDRSVFFRLTVNVSYKSEPQRFDIVAGCNTLDILYKDNSRTHEVGLVPTVYGRRMTDGRGLVVRVPDACGGETTAGGQVPQNLMPVLIVYDDAATLGFGRAYMADEAYDSPNSVMRFGSATIAKATRAEFEAFRTKGEPNLVTREQYHSAQPLDQVEKMGLTKVYPAFGRSCWAYRRSLIPEQHRAALRRFWPAERPKFWIVRDTEQRKRMREAIDWRNSERFARDDGRRAGDRSFALFEPGEGGYRRDGVKRIGPSTKPYLEYAPALYPASSDISGPRFPNQPSQWPAFIAGLKHVSIMDVDVAGTANRGFAYCYIGNPLALPTHTELFPLLRQTPGALTVDGQIVAGAPDHWTDWMTDLTPIFEEDRFLYVFKPFDLESTRGDV
jgi:hypothetical protein